MSKRIEHKKEEIEQLTKKLAQMQEGNPFEVTTLMADLSFQNL